MSIERINRQSYINSYNTNTKKCLEKIQKNNNSDRIEISDIGKSLKEYSLEIDTNNSKKIEDIKNKLSSGTYNVDGRLTAKSLLDTMKGCKL